MKLLSIIPLAAILAMADEPKLEFDEFSAKMALQFGHIIHGEYRTPETNTRALHHVALNRNIVFMEQDGKYGDSWEFNAGFMGILWWPFVRELGAPSTRTVRVQAQVAIIKARLNFGSDENKSFMDIGYFPYKYNPDAWNLGEYLYRSGTYPGEVKTSDGFRLMDHAAYDAFGLHLHLSTFSGHVNHEANLFLEPNSDPIGDVTPAYEINLNLNILRLGAGAAYNRGLAYHPSQSRPSDPGNRYIETDTTKGVPYYKGPLQGAPAEIQDPSQYNVLHEWTQRGLKLMGRAALDFGFLLPENLRRPDDLRIFSEIAVLGWENQPYYYEKRSQRMPIMFGLNLPTFTLLDLLSLQAEYYDAPFNDTYSYYVNSLPIWKLVDYQTQDHDRYKPSKWRWSIFGSKSFNKLVGIQAQVASDHMRLRDDLSMPTEYEVILYPKNWYYLLQFQVGI